MMANSYGRFATMATPCCGSLPSIDISTSGGGAGGDEGGGGDGLGGMGGGGVGGGGEGGGGAGGGGAAKEPNPF